MLETINRQ